MRSTLLTSAPRTRLALVLGATVSSLLAAAPASAQLLVDPTGGTNVSPLMGGNGYVRRVLGNPFPLAGYYPITSVLVLNNGLVTPGGPDIPGGGEDRGLSSLAQLYGSFVFAPLYDCYGGGRIVENATSAYTAYTYQDFSGCGGSSARPPMPTGSSTFQVALFSAATTVGGFGFLPGDVAFSYGAIEHTISGTTATVGVGLSLDTAVPVPGSADGQITSLSGLPNTGGRFLLFRPNGAASVYAVSTQQQAQVVPEPGSVALVGVGLAGFTVVRRRRGAPSPRL